MPSRALTLLILMAILLALLALSVWRRAADDAYGLAQKTITPIIMGTTCRLTAVGHPDRVDSALERAFAELAEVNRLASTYDPQSPLSLFNKAPADTGFVLDPPLIGVMRASREISVKTGGAFDITMRPIGLLWRESGRKGRLPSDASIDSALALVGYENLVLGDSTALKTVEGMQVSLDAIIKGYAVDQALKALWDAGMSAGLVEVGGDIACFGAPPGAQAWRVGVQDPWEEKTVGILGVPPEGVSSVGICTSGNYRRFVEIDGVRYSHIVDPRTGRTPDAIPSVTVIAPDAMTADAWATALSVLSYEEGRPLIEAEPGVEALWIGGSGSDPWTEESSGFSNYWANGR